MALSFTRPIFNSSLASRVSNCITEVPNNIALEILPDKLLKIKAGTVFYIPSGADNFIETILSKDIICPKLAQSNGEFTVYLSKSEEAFFFTTITQYSALEKPAATGTHVFYNLTDDTIKIYSDDVISTPNVSLPIARVILKDGYIDNIKEVFNGFGYMSETPFILPEVRAFIPKGLDDQSDYASYEFINDKVRINKNLINESCKYLFLDNTGNLLGWGADYFEQREKPIGVFSHAMWYDSYNNIMYQTMTGDSNFVPVSFVNLGKVVKAGQNKRITEFNVRRSFVLQQNALSQIVDDSKYSYPSNKAVQTYVENNGGAADNKTINKNVDKQLQAIGIIEKNKGTIKYDWIGTEEEWTVQDLENTHPDWICYIIDDTSEGGGGGGGNPDKITITKNAKNQLQSVGMLEQNTQTAVYDWVGTKEQHTTQNIAAEHPDWICYITDDTSSGGTESANISLGNLDAQGLEVIRNNSRTINQKDNSNIYDWVGTQQEFDEQKIATTHPDWVWYITDDLEDTPDRYTNSEINVLLETKLNKNVLDGCDYVIDYYPKTAEERTVAKGSWWRKYKSGWLEQGGLIHGLTTWTWVDVTLLKPYLDTTYCIALHGISHTAIENNIGTLNKKTSTGFKYSFYNNQGAGLEPSWYTCGQGA